MTQPSNQAVYVISVFATLAGVHPQTLRNYERTGLLAPQRTSGGSRRFSDADLAALRRIQELTNEGVNLEGVKRIMRLEAELAATRARLESLAAQARADLAAVQRAQRRDLVPVSNSLSILFSDMRNRRDV